MYNGSGGASGASGRPNTGMLAATASLTAADPARTARHGDVDRVLIVDEFIERVHSTNQRLIHLIDRTRDHADALFGEGRGKAESVSGANPPIAGRLPGLAASISTTDLLVNELYEQLNRLSAV